MDVRIISNLSVASQIAYAIDLSPSESSTALSEDISTTLSDEGVTPAQADHMASLYEVVTHQENTDSGFSATLLRSRSDPAELVLAMRGSDQGIVEGADGTANVGNFLDGVAREQIVDMLNFYRRLVSDTEVTQYRYDRVALPIWDAAPGPHYELLDVIDTVAIYGVLSEKDVTASGLGALTPGTPLTVTGHSLGGHLASAFALLFPALTANGDSVFTFNSAGLMAWAGDDFGSFASLLQDAITDIPLQPGSRHTVATHNFNAPSDIVSQWLGAAHLGGGLQEIFAEAAPGDVRQNHAIDPLTDSLAVLATLQGLNANLSFEQLNEILETSSNEWDRSLELLTHNLATLFDLPGPDTAAGDHEDVFQALNALHQADAAAGGALFDGNRQIEFLSHHSAAALKAIAALDDSDRSTGYRYALAHLAPFALTGEFAGTAVDNPAYDLENFSDAYLADRALMLSILLPMNFADRPAGALSELTRFTDLARDIDFAGDRRGFDSDWMASIGLSPETFEDARARYIFGSQEADTPLASATDDRLYGLGGDDVLDGLAGDDYFEGGEGDDQLRGGDGTDILLADDGNDHLYGGPGTDFLVGGAGADRFYWNDGDGEDILGDFDDGGDRIIVNGVDLAVLQARQALPGSAFYRDAARPDILFALDEATDALTVLIGGTSGEGRIQIDQYNPGAGNYGIELLPWQAPTAPGTDFVVTRVGTSSGETDRHAFYRERGDADFAHRSIRFDADAVENYSGGTFFGMVGGAFEGGPLDDHLTGNAQSNALHGLGGADLIEGGAGDDFLAGGGGSDTLSGGAGSDILFGNERTGYLESLDPDSDSRDAFYLPLVTEAPADLNRLDGGGGADFLSGGEYSDELGGGEGADYALGGSGADLISGGEGHDRLYGDSRLNTALFAVGDDQSSLRLEIDWADGTGEVTDYDDELHGGAGDDILWGELGDDVLHGGVGDDWLGGDREIIGNFFEEEFVAYDDSTPFLDLALHGDDQLFGGAGDDTLLGHGGDDLLAGGSGSDQLGGGSGDDAYLLSPGDGVDNIVDAHGQHTLVFQDLQPEELDVVFRGDSVRVGNGDDWLVMPRSQWANTHIAITDRNNLIERSRLDTWYLDNQGNLLLRVEGLRGISEADRDTILRVDDSEPQQPRLVLGPNATQLRLENGGFESGAPRVEITGGDSLLFWTQVVIELAQDLAQAIAEGDPGVLDLSLPHTVTVGVFAFSGDLQGTALNDHIVGGPEDDTLIGFQGRDLLEGGEGNDSLDGGPNADTLDGGPGDDILFGLGENDLLIGGRGGDYLAGGYGLDTYRFSNESGGDTLDDPDTYRLEFNGVATAEAVLTYTGSAESTFYISAGAGNHVAADGDTRASNLAGVFIDGLAVPVIQRSELTNGTFYSSKWHDLFEPGAGNDTLHTDGAGDDVYSFASGGGADTIVLEHVFGPDRMGTLRFAPEVDFRAMTFEFDPLLGDATIHYGEDSIHIDGDLFPHWDNALGLFTLSSAADPGLAPVIRLAGDGTGWLRGSFGTDHIMGGDGSQWIRPGYGDDLIQAGDGDDQILLSGHYLPAGRHSGGIGHKRIQGEGGDDFIRAPLHQGLTFVYNLGDGYDTVEYDWSYDTSAVQYPYNIPFDYQTGTLSYVPMGEDVLELGPGITLNNLSFTRIGDALEISLITGDGEIRFSDFFRAWDVDPRQAPQDPPPFVIEGFQPDLLTDPAVLAQMPESPVARIRLADGTEHDMAQLLRDRMVEEYLGSGATVVGSNGDDVLHGARDRDDIIFGRRGNDTIVDEGGSNVIDGGDGDDTITARGADQSILAGDGNDTVDVEGVVNTIDLGAGEDSLKATGDINEVTTGSGSSSLELIGQQNTVTVGAGFHVLSLIGEDNRVLLDDQPGLIYVGFARDAGTRAVVELGAGIGPGDIQLRTQDFGLGPALEMHIPSVDQTLGVLVFDPSALQPLHDRTLTELRFADGTVLDESQLLQLSGLVPEDGDQNTAGPDVLTGGEGADVLAGGGGDDALFGLGGHDTLSGGDGDDRLTGGTGDDVLNGGAGNDLFLVGGVDQGYDRVIGGSGFDVLRGGPGADLFGLSQLTVADSLERIEGGGGFFNVIGGNSEANILDFSATEFVNILAIIGDAGDDIISGTAGSDVIRGDTGDDTLLGGAGDDLFLMSGLGDGFDRIVGADGFDTLRGGDGADLFGLTSLTPADSLERIEGGAGVLNVISGDGSANTLDFSATEFMDVPAIVGGAGDDHITGSSTDDYIRGDAGDDWLDGGAGDDRLIGSAGNDTYLFGPGGGRDTVENADADPASTDRLLLAEIAYDALWFSRDGADLTIDLVGSDDRLTFDDWYLADSARIDSISAGQHLLHREQLDQLVSAMAAFDAPQGAGAVIPPDVRQQLEPVLTTVWQAA